MVEPIKATRVTCPFLVSVVLYIIDINLVVSLCTDYTPDGELVYWKWSHSGGERRNLLGMWRGKVEGHVGAPSNCLQSTNGIYAQKHLYHFMSLLFTEHLLGLIQIRPAGHQVVLSRVANPPPSEPDAVGLLSVILQKLDNEVLIVVVADISLKI